MGADFCYQIIPLCKLTKNRKEKLYQILDSMTIEQFDPDFYLFDENKIEDIKATVKGYIDTYESLADRRDVGHLWLHKQMYILSGGMSWGDNPTTYYEDLEVFEAIPKIWNQLEVWSKGDGKDGPNW